MADSERSTTPPRQTLSSVQNVSPITPEQVRRMEEARLKAKALRNQQDQINQRRGLQRPQQAQPVTGVKRPLISSSHTPSNNRDARSSAAMGPAAGPRAPNSNSGLAAAQDIGIRPAKKFQKYVEYDFSKMTDTKAGFMTHEDDPWNKALHKKDENDERPAHMTLKEWEQLQLRRRLRDQRSGPFEPGLSVLDKTAKKCRECGSLEIDWQWDELLNAQVCNTCKEKYPEKYSLLTKTEAKEDYLLTDPELRDAELLPHLEKPNPHKSTWNNMMLYLRFQVEDYVFSERKWGSPEALDAEFERRQTEAKQRKEKKFKTKLNELKKRTRVDAYKRGRAGGGGEFGDTLGKGKHEHEWGRSVEDPETGAMKKSCVECGMEVEELEF